MEYEFLSNETLVDILQQNMAALAGAIQEMLGDSPFPDPREISKILGGMSCAQYLEELRYAKDIFLRNLDLQELAAQLSRENVDIHKELLKRI